MPANTKLVSQQRRIRRTRAKVVGTPERPRLSVSFSNRNITAQLIDDTSQKTLAQATTTGAKPGSVTPLSDRAVKLAEVIATKAKAAGIKTVVLDRRHKPYHGRVKAFADSLRQSGLEL